VGLSILLYQTPPFIFGHSSLIFAEEFIEDEALEEELELEKAEEQPITITR
jgi:hypothetical protein